MASGEPRYPNVHVQLTGEDGNGMFIVGKVRRALRAHGVPAHEVSNFTEEAMSGDYDNLLATCLRWVDCD